MNVFGKIFGGKTEKKSDLGIGVAVFTGTKYKKISFKDLANEGYLGNAIVNRCVKVVANSVATIPFKIMDGDKEIADHPLGRLMMRPNKMQSHSEYFKALVSYLMIDGNAYALRIDSGGREPVALQMLRPDRVEIKIHERTQLPVSYKYRVGKRAEQIFEADPISGESVVKHFKEFDPTDDVKGVSPLVACAKDIDLLNGILTHNNAILQNGGMPSGILEMSFKDEDNNPVAMTKEQRENIRTEFKRKHTGVGRSGEPMVTDTGTKFIDLTSTAKEMDYLRQLHVSARNVALVCGVPAQIIGIPDSQTYANYHEARLSLYQETVIPLAKRIAGDINEWLAPRFGDRVKFVYDIESIQALADQRTQKIDVLVNAVKSGLMTTNEARAEITLDDDPNGDVLLVDGNRFPLAEIVGQTLPSENDPTDDPK